MLQDGVRAQLTTYPPSSSLVRVLYVIEYESTTAAANATIRVEAARLYASTRAKMTFLQSGHSDSANWERIWELCAIGGHAYVGGDTGPCTVAVRSWSWGGVKSLYRDAATR